MTRRLTINECRAPCIVATRTNREGYLKMKEFVIFSRMYACLSLDIPTVFSFSIPAHRRCRLSLGAFAWFSIHLFSFIQLCYLRRFLCFFGVRWARVPLRDGLHHNSTIRIHLAYTSSKGFGSERKKSFEFFFNLMCILAKITNASIQPSHRLFSKFQLHTYFHYYFFASFVSFSLATCTRTRRWREMERKL